MSTPFSVYSGQGHDLRFSDEERNAEKGPHANFDDVMLSRHRLYLYLREEEIVPEYGQVIWCSQRKQDVVLDDHYSLLHILQITNENVAALIDGAEWSLCIHENKPCDWHTLVKTDPTTKVRGDQILIRWPEAKQLVTSVTPIPQRSGNVIDPWFCGEEDLSR